MKVSRRELILYGLATCSCFPSSPSVTKERGGCMLQRGSAIGDQPLIPAENTTVGWSSRLENELVQLNSVFQVKPLFRFVDDGYLPNAYASPEVNHPRFPDGTVLFGIGMFASIRQKFPNHFEDVVISLLAHEWAHIKQFKIGVSRSWIVRDELSADYMAGTYLAIRSFEQARVQAASRAFGYLGDTSFQDPQHHGTPQQRSRLFLEQFRHIRREHEIAKFDSQRGVHSIPTLIIDERVVQASYGHGM